MLQGDLDTLDGKIDMLRGDMDHKIDTLRGDMDRQFAEVTDRWTARIGDWPRWTASSIARTGGWM